MKSQLSKSERKYRSKIIAEEHLDKYWQGVLDEYMGRRVTKFLGISVTLIRILKTRYSRPKIG